MGVTAFLKFGDFNPESRDHTCIAITSKKKRCRNCVYGRPRIVPRDLQEAVVKQSPEENVYDTLVAYAKRNLCNRHNHFSSKIEESVLQWAEEIDEQCRLNPNADGSTTSVNAAHDSVYDAAYSAFKLFREPRSEQETYKIWEHDPRYNVLRLLLRSLDKRDQNAGNIYILSRENKPGYIKIGTTTRSVHQRTVQLKHQCGYDTQTLLSISRVHFARRVEQLIFAELQIYRRQEMNCKCGVEHSEWFQIDTGLAEAVVRKWSDLFTESQLYDENGVLKWPVTHMVGKMKSQGIDITATSLKSWLESSNFWGEDAKDNTDCDYFVSGHDNLLEVGSLAECQNPAKPT